MRSSMPRHYEFSLSPAESQQRGPPASSPSPFPSFPPLPSLSPCLGSTSPPLLPPSLSFCFISFLLPLILFLPLPPLPLPPPFYSLLSSSNLSLYFSPSSSPPAPLIHSPSPTHPIHSSSLPTLLLHLSRQGSRGGVWSV